MGYTCLMMLSSTSYADPENGSVLEPFPTMQKYLRITDIKTSDGQTKSYLIWKSLMDDLVCYYNVSNELYIDYWNFACITKKLPDL